MLEGATRELLAAAPEDRDLLQMRLGRSAKQLTDKLDGPEGARIALAFARLSLDVFEDCDSASESIERAIRMEGDLDDYAALAPYAARLVASPKARDVLDRALASAQKPYASIGVPALKLLAALATHLGDAQAHAQAVVIAAERDPEDDALVLEADVVVRELGDAALVERLGKKVPPSRRVAALRAWAREKILAGAHVEAAAALERAAEIGDAGTKIELEAELRRAYEAAGRGNEIEQRVQREAASDEATPAMRAMRWTEIADRREVRRDLPGTIRALQEAARLDPGPVERWSALERVAELAGDDGVRIGALREIAERVQSDGRIAVHKRLARAYERRGDGAAAEATWHIVLKLDPEDEESDRAMEALIAADGRYAALADHLARRAERLATHSGKRDALRAVRLRRAAILEQRLGRVQDACDELAILLAEWPDNASALRYLADLSERAGDFARAAPLWRRATALEVDPNTQDELELRAASASKSAGDSASALRHVRAVLVRHPESHVALELHVELAREMGLLAELGEALEALATAEAASHIGRSDMLVEAAQSAARIGDAPLALSRAQKAAVIGPERPAPQLLARGLEYRLRGAGDPNDARRTIDDLKKIRGTLAPEDAALRTFLLAEALDVAQGGGAGMRELEALSPELGKSALIAVGIAERMAAQGNHAAALPHFDDALRGNLLGLRKQGSVALAAAESAVRCMQLEDAHRLYQLASGDPESRFTALTRLGHLAVTQGWFERAARILPELASAASTEEHARTLLELVHLSLSSAEGPDRGDAESLVAALFAAIPEGSALRARMQAELAAARRATPSPPSPVRAPAPAQGRAPASFVARARSEADLLAPIPDGTSAAPPPHGQHLEPGVDRELADLEAAVGAAKTPEARAHAQIALAGAYLDQRAFASAEQVLWKALGEGSVQAGDQLAHTLAPAIERSADVVRVRRAQVDLAPGDLSLLEALRAAALADADKVYARAIEHVARAFDIAAGPLPPPPLAAQVERPGMMALLTRPSQAPIGEALGLVWEGAPAAFLRDPKTYGITGVGRVVPGSTSAVARLYDTAIRLLDAPRIPLFVSRPTGALSASVALIAPPSVILGGDVREDSPELRFVLGRGMSAALHSNVLVLGMSYKDVSSLRRALASAFGPPEIRSSLDAESSRLAEQFWQLIPPRVQRRLQELLSATEVPEYEELVAPAHQSGRRVGLFLAGDFATAARAVFDEFSLRVEGASASGGLRRYCQDLPALADLLRLAVSPEYADARWQPVAPASQRGSKSSSRFSIV